MLALLPDIAQHTLRVADLIAVLLALEWWQPEAPQLLGVVADDFLEIDTHVVELAPPCRLRVATPISMMSATINKNQFMFNFHRMRAARGMRQSWPAKNAISPRLRRNRCRRPNCRRC